LIYNGLVKHDKDINLMPELAESWQFSRDCLDLRFKLRRNVRWHDNQPFTADDVCSRTPRWSTRRLHRLCRRLQAGRVGHGGRSLHIHVHYKHPHARALQSWGIWMLPKHLLEKAMLEGKLRESPRTAPRRWGRARTSSRNEAGREGGPHRNPDYFEGRPYISRVVYRIIPARPRRSSS